MRVSCMEVEDQRRLDDAITTQVLEDRFRRCSIETTFLRERQIQKNREIALRKAMQEEAEVRRIEKRTQDFVEGQILWHHEIKDVKPLRR